MYMEANLKQAKKDFVRTWINAYIKSLSAIDPHILIGYDGLT